MAMISPHSAAVRSGETTRKWRSGVGNGYGEGEGHYVRPVLVVRVDGLGVEDADCEANG